MPEFKELKQESQKSTTKDLPLGEVEQQKKDETNIKEKHSKEELLRIFDEIMFSGEYKETIKIKGKLAVTFRTRTTEEAMAISRELDNRTYQLVTTQVEDRAFQNLLYSLADYQGKSLIGVSKEDRIKILGRLPVQLIAAMSDALSAFDDKISEACREAEVNF